MFEVKVSSNIGDIVKALQSDELLSAKIVPAPDSEKNRDIYRIRLDIPLNSDEDNAFAGLERVMHQNIPAAVLKRHDGHYLATVLLDENNYDEADIGIVTPRIERLKEIFLRYTKSSEPSAADEIRGLFLHICYSYSHIIRQFLP
jgi:hypothetical protein